MIFVAVKNYLLIFSISSSDSDREREGFLALAGSADGRREL